VSINIEKFKAEEKTRLCLMKHRGNVSLAGRELDIPVEFVKKVAHRMKEKCTRDVSYFIATNLMQHILLGYQQRVSYLEECLRILRGKEESLISSCCSFPVKRRGRTRITYECLKCGKPCSVTIIDKNEIYNLKFRVIEMLREEDRALVDFADKMGYTNKDYTPASTVKQNILVMNKPDLDSSVAEDLQNLRPMDREKVRKRLEKHIFNSASTAKEKK